MAQSATEAPFLAGPGGNLYRGIPPEVYLKGSNQNWQAFKWCFWPVGCILRDGDEIVPLEPGAEFNLQQSTAQSFQNFDFGRGAFDGRLLQHEALESPLLDVN